MTRINVVPPEELCDQHLLAEWRELTRIPNGVASGKFKLTNIPDEYVLGTGHVKFFLNKLYFLLKRYIDIMIELENRDMPQRSYWTNQVIPYPELWGDYEPTEEALRINRERIKERMPKNPRFSKGGSI